MLDHGSVGVQVGNRFVPTKQDLSYARGAAKRHEADIAQVANGLLELGSFVMGIAGTLLAGQAANNRRR
jgi:hypothetical protein